MVRYTPSRNHLTDATITGELTHTGDTLGFYGVTTVTRPTAYTQNYATADRTLNAYTADNESTAYAGNGGGTASVSAAADVANVADLNALRTAYENLRALSEDTAQIVNALIDDLQNNGLVQ